MKVQILFALMMVLVTLCLGQKMQRGVIEDVCNNCETNCQLIKDYYGRSFCQDSLCQDSYRFCTNLEFTMDKCKDENSNTHAGCVTALLSTS
uniref:Teretoxin Tan22.13 n=1 Tax=Terebra anilis TaxID=553697 RepID=TMD_TERAN|nr:RecName: Full=Teretoxin Tan22.13; Flags: Precursor [Terebra anilis]